MNPRQKMSFAFAILWTILGLVVSSSGSPLDMNEGEEGKVEIPSVVVPQIGVLEERPDGSSVGKDAVPIIISGPSVPGSSPGQNDAKIENAGKGILVPIVAVSDVDSSKSGTNGNINNPLVALLPAPLSPNAQVPNPTPSVLQNDQPSADKPEIRRSITTGNDAEMMDVAEDIVFRPLFKIRQQQNSMRNFNRNYRPNYRRYNVNGYYRLPYNYFESN